MKDTPNIEGVFDPRRGGGDKDDVVNPKKFRDMMHQKVDESDATEKREKRNRPRQQEEETDEVSESKEPEAPHTDFKDFMKDPKKTTSIFDPSKGKSQIIRDNEVDDNAPPSAIRVFTDSKKGVDSDKRSSLDIESPKESSQDQPDVETIGKSRKKDKAEDLDRSDQTEKDKKTEKTEQQQAAEKAEKKKKPSQLTKEEKELSGETPIKDDKTKMAPLSKPLSKEELEKAALEKEKETTAPESTEKSQLKEKEKQAEIQKEVKKEKQEVTESQTPAPSTAKPDAEGTFGDDSHKEGKKDDSSLSQIVAPQHAMTPPANIAPPTPTQAPTYTKLPSEVFELFEKLVGLMTIEQYKGDSTTTIRLNMPNSIFNQCEIQLKHFGTAPGQFNLQLLGNPEAVNKFTQHMTGLQAAFTGNVNYQVNVQPPALLREHRHIIHRKSGSEGQDNSQDSDQQQTQ